MAARTPTLPIPLVEPIDHVLFAGRRVRIGAFRCGTDHPDFERAGAIDGYDFVFPRTAVWIQHAEGQPFVADAATVTLYNRGQAYRRLPLDARGDRADWFSVDQDMAVEAASLFETIPDARAERPWPARAVPCEPRLYLRQRLLVQGLRRGEVADDLLVEEAVSELLRAVLAAGRGGAPASRRWTGVPSQQRVVERTRALLAERFREPLGLVEIARAVGSSLFHLSGLFRGATGVTLHAWRHRLRLHAALEALAGPASGGDLTGLALDLGFSSHSHFSAAFRAAFGAPPSRIRRALAVGQVAVLAAALERRRGV